MTIRSIIATLFVVIQFFGPAAMAGQRVLVQSTTSTENSGLYRHILPMFMAETGIRVDVVAVGTGQAIRNASQGDADVLLVHSKADEEAFVAAGHGLLRHDLMYNDFVIVGLESDPAEVAGMPLNKALSQLAARQAVFVSRGDDSGTHKKERALWATVGEMPEGSWYRETGSGMGASLRVAIEMGAYILTDRGTWIAFQDKGDHQIMVEHDPALFNQYGLIAVNPERHAHVNGEGAAVFVDWLVGEQGQAAIAGYRVDGQQLFFPNAAVK
ncbi:MAG: substrate-binding domain-containing protein [Pikeienuella sp.]